MTSGSPLTFNLLFVCLGNICRSPIAEFVFRDMVEKSDLSGVISVRSAGTGDWHVGEQADPMAREVALAHDIDLSPHRARKFERQWFDDFDLVVAMDRMNVKALQQYSRKPEDAEKVELLRAYDPQAATQGDFDVPDPYGASRRAFELVYQAIDTGCQGLFASVRAAVDS